MLRTLLTAVLAVTLITSGIGLSLAADGPPVRAVDDDQRLATDAGVQEYQSMGSVTTSLSAMQLDVTVADSADAVDAPGLHVDQTTTYIRVDYDEAIPRTVRLHVAEEIVTPRIKQDKHPIQEDANVSADFEVVDGGDRQSITLHLEGKTDAVFAVSTVTGQIQEVKRDVTAAASQGLENLTGVSLPSFGGGQWERVPDDALSGENVSASINSTEATVQYQDGDGAWLSAPECAADTPVCTLQRDNKTVIVSQTTDAPPVRYKTTDDLRARLSSALDDIASVPDDVGDWLSDLLGGEE